MAFSWTLDTMPSTDMYSMYEKSDNKLATAETAATLRCTKFAAHTHVTHKREQPCDEGYGRPHNAVRERMWRCYSSICTSVHLAGRAGWALMTCAPCSSCFPT